MNLQLGKVISLLLTESDGLISRLCNVWHATGRLFAVYPQRSI